MTRDFYEKLRRVDIFLIWFFRKISEPLSRLGLFIVFFWFGILKVLGLSPASSLVKELFVATIPFMSFDVFIVLFGWFEALIGILFLIRGAERLVMPLLFIHMVTTFMPLFLVPQETWSAFLVPTLEGQYIVKNLVLIAAAVVVAAHLHPIKKG